MNASYIYPKNFLKKLELIQKFPSQKSEKLRVTNNQVVSVYN